MKPPMTTCAALLVLLAATIAAAQTPAGYRQGTITKNTGPHKSYDLKGAEALYQINNCGDFQSGQSVDYRVDDLKIYIRREGGKEYKCDVEMRSAGARGAEADAPPRPKYQQGTILGYDIRRDIYGGGGGGNGTPGSPVQTRRAKVYELKGSDLIYKVDYCGAFQAGQFGIGQVVEYRIDRERLYIRHDNDKEYSCKIEGTRAAEDVKPNAAPATDPSAKQ
jgi:hypothetical protein